MLHIAIYNKTTKEVRYKESWPNTTADEAKNALMQLNRLGLECQLLRPDTWELWGDKMSAFDWKLVQ